MGNIPPCLPCHYFWWKSEGVRVHSILSFLEVFSDQLVFSFKLSEKSCDMARLEARPFSDVLDTGPTNAALVCPITEGEKNK
jgi:hypothetical protein